MAASTALAGLDNQSHPGTLSDVAGWRERGDSVMTQQTLSVCRECHIFVPGRTACGTVSGTRFTRD
jgi:hypothetical protein